MYQYMLVLQYLTAHQIIVVDIIIITREIYYSLDQNIIIPTV